MNTKIDTPQGLEVTFQQKEILSYQKEIKVEKDGVVLVAEINYDDYDGYGITWYTPKVTTLQGQGGEYTVTTYEDAEEPKWATEYADLTSYHELAYLLDEMGVEK